LGLFYNRYHVVEEFNKGVYDIIIASDESNKNDFSAARGVDFKNVNAVINFEIPVHYASYCHRIGRTARGGSSGWALTFVNQNGVKFDAIAKEIKEANKTIEPFSFDMSQVEGFRYRMEDAMRSVTKASIKEARLKEIKQEILNSEHLKVHLKILLYFRVILKTSQRICNY
jgi:ATP-dependent RNA helicase DDX56/DBP9